MVERNLVSLALSVHLKNQAAKFDMKKQILYKDLARYYDLIYSSKDYEAEAKDLKTVIAKYKKSTGKDLLDVACGTGKHLEYLKRWYSCVGLDVSQAMLDIARKKVKGITFRKGDMTELKLDKNFDIITCLFSSIGYVRTYKNLQKTLVGFSKHLKPGGVVIIGPWLTSQTYHVGFPHMTTYNSPDIKIARLSVSEQRGNISIMDMHYLIAERNRKTAYFVDRHELGMFEQKRFLELMTKAGFKARYIKSRNTKDRGLYIGVKR